MDNEAEGAHTNVEVFAGSLVQLLVFLYPLHDLLLSLDIPHPQQEKISFTTRKISQWSSGVSQVMKLLLT